ncbi:MAG: FAD-dependent oxidoreductase [Anaerolineae bacterium]|nr:FAD-dependent oxidoreductase [Anaerolineae bacterium]
MSQIVVIGAGLTGLAACRELEQLGVNYTLIEVKPRLGGSIQTTRQDGFVFDNAAFDHEKNSNWPFLDALEMNEAEVLRHVGKCRDGALVVFRDGTDTLVTALSKTLKHTVMTRMAVSSIGFVDDRRLGICLENGLMLETRGIVAALPARYAEHMLRSLSIDAAFRLLDYEYDPTIRVSLGCHRRDLNTFDIDRAHERAAVAGAPLKFLQLYTHAELPERIPAEHVMLRVGLRLSEMIQPANALEFVIRVLENLPPLAHVVGWWPEGDPLTRDFPEHSANMDALDALLPPNVAIAGSDYRARGLNDQVEQGRAAARKVAANIG